MACTPNAQDSEYELIKKILIGFNNASGITDPCLMPQSGDSTWDLWYKILQSINLL